MITILNARFWIFFSDTEYVIYPLLLDSTQQVIWQISLILIVIGGFLYFIFRPPVSPMKHIGRGIFVTLVVMIETMFVGPAVSSPISSASVNGMVYHLSQVGGGGFSGTIRFAVSESLYALFECDKVGIVCHQVHQQIFVSSRASFPPGVDASFASDAWELVPITLEADPATNTVSILSDGRVVYAYQADE